MFKKNVQIFGHFIKIKIVNLIIKKDDLNLIIQF